MTDIKQKDRQYIAATYSRFDVALTRGKGSIVWDEDGREYIDLSTGIAVNTLGIADDEWVAAVTAQLSTLPHTSNLYYSAPDALLAEMLCNKTGMKKVFFSNSGAEANECAIKAARKYAADKYGAERHVIVTLINSFHGRTVTTLAATGQDVFHKDFTPLTSGFEYIAANDCAALEKYMASGRVAAVMMEPVQGEGGVIPLEPEFVKKAAALADRYDVLLICDEVQTGNGRSGSLYAYMNYGIMPDIVTTAKGLAGGLPLGATMLGEKVKNVFTAGTHGSTFGGNPVCCAGALSILSRIDEALLEGVRQRSEYIISRLSACEGVVSVTGMGLMLGIQTKRQAAAVIDDCRKNGVLVIGAKGKVRLLPALNIPMELLEKAIGVIENACKGE